MSDEALEVFCQYHLHDRIFPRGPPDVNRDVEDYQPEAMEGGPGLFSETRFGILRTAIKINRKERKERRDLEKLRDFWFFRKVPV